MVVWSWSDLFPIIHPYTDVNVAICASHRLVNVWSIFFITAVETIYFSDHGDAAMMVSDG